MPIAELSAALSGITQIVNLTRNLGDAIKASGKSEAMGLVIDLQSAVLELQIKTHDVVQENHRLREEVDRLNQELNRHSKVHLYHGAYWLTSDVEDGLLGPYSVELWDKEKKLVLMRQGGAYKPFRDSPEEHIGFQCSETKRNTHVPIDFMRKHKVWPEEEITNALKPKPSPVITIQRNRSRGVF